MKKLYSLFLAAVCCGSLSAQVMKIHQGQVTTLVPASVAAEYAIDKSTPGAFALVVGDVKYPFTEIDSVTFARGEWTACNVAVNYAGSVANVEVGYDVATNADIAVTGADVSIVQDPLLQEEVFYTLSGASADGSFFMDGEFKATVTLNGLELTSQKGAAIDIANGKRINVILADGTNNVLADAAGGTQKACLFVNGHAEFDGAGSLTLTGNAKHAFASDEYTELKTGFGKITVISAVGDGLHVKQYFDMEDGEIEVLASAGDGIDVEITNDPTEELNGQFMMTGGKITLDVAAEDVKGIKCDSLMSILGGEINIKVPGNGSKGISAPLNMIIGTTTGGPTINVAATGTTYMPGNATLEAKCQGIRVKGNLDMYGGVVTVTATGKSSKSVKVDGNYRKHGGIMNATPAVDW